jgi:SPP1 gp7 family putative phage head morphogenesis protein
MSGAFPKYNPDLLRTYKGYRVYSEMMTDDQVKPCLEFKKQAIISRAWRFNVKKDDNDEKNEKQQEIADFFNFVICQIKDSWADNLLLILSAIEQGYSISEKNYKTIVYNGKTYWGIKDIKLRPYETFDGGIKVDEHGNIIEIKQFKGGTDVALPLDKIIYFVHNKTVDMHYGESDLKAAYRAWWAKDITIKLHNLYLERMAGGFLYAAYKGNLSNDAKIALKALINNVSGKMGAMLPDTVELKLFPAVSTDAYERAISMHDKSISKSLLVPNLLGLSEQGSTGSYAQSDIQKDMFFMINSARAKELEEILNEHLFKQLAIWNFGTEDFPRFKFDDLSNEEKSKLAMSWSDLLSKRAVTHSDTDEQHVRNLLNFPEKKEGVEIENPIDDAQLGLIDKPPAGSSPSPADVVPQKKYAEKIWLHRVDFAEIKKDLDSNDKAFGTEFADAMGQVKDNLIKQIMTIVGNRSLGNVKLNEFKALHIQNNLLNETKKILKKNIENTFNSQIEIAKKELPKQHGEKLILPGMDTTQVTKFLREKGEFYITGVLEPDVLNSVMSVLQNGVLYDKSLKQIILDLEKNTKLASLLPMTDSAGRAVDIPFRIETIVRTNNGSAMNLARTTLFNREEFKGFIEAFEYSAVLDDRVTDICESLNGRIMKDWGQYTPPNHFNCRSILVPVTILDEWSGKEDEIPSGVIPAEGFH